MKNIKIHINRLIITILLILFVLPVGSVFAADLSLVSQHTSYLAGSDVVVKVMLNTADDSINAVEGKLSFAAELLDVKDINDGNSSINFWVEKPNVVSAGVVSFSGVIAGGVINPKATLFTIVFKAKVNGTGYIKFTDTRVLKNDGKGTQVALSLSPLQLVISDDANPFLESSTLDATLPETFEPSISSSTSAFQGRYFLAFSANDKDSGIDHYEVKEGSMGHFENAESPYLLKDQSLTRDIFVKAVDKAGNYRIETLPAQNKIPWYENYIILAIIILVLALIIIMRKLKW